MDERPKLSNYLDYRFEFSNLLKECNTRIPAQTIAKYLGYAKGTVYAWKSKDLDKLPRSSTCKELISKLNKLIESYDPALDPNRKRQRQPRIKRTTITAIDLSKLSNPGTYQVDQQGLVTKVNVDNPMLITLTHLNTRRNILTDRIVQIEREKVALEDEYQQIKKEESELANAVEVLRVIYKKEVGA